MLRVRVGTDADIPSVIRLERECSTAAHWSETQYRNIFQTDERGRSARLVLVVDDASSSTSDVVKDGTSRETRDLSGFLIARQIGPEWELENVLVSSSARRRGLASLMFAQLLENTRRANGEAVFLEVRESNRAARAAYGKWGFVEEGRRKSYYANPLEDAVLYRYSLR